MFFEVGSIKVLVVKWMLTKMMLKRKRFQIELEVGVSDRLNPKVAKNS